MKLFDAYKASIKSVCENVKKQLAYTLVKEYTFSFSSHFIDRLVERKIPVNVLHNMLIDVCTNNRHVFSLEGKVIVEFDDTRFVFFVHHNVMDCFRRIVFMTAYESDEYRDKIYKSTNKVVFLKLEK